MKKEFIDHFKRIPGAVSVAEAVGLFLAVKEHISKKTTHAVDLGSHSGKSSSVGSAALTAAGIEGIFYMVDPLYDAFNPEAWKESTQSTPNTYGYDIPSFKKEVLSLVSKFSSMEFELYGISSIQFLKETPFSFGYAFIDTDDHSDTLKKELPLLLPKMIPGGIIIFHDYGNQYHVPFEEAKKLVDSGEYFLVPIDWEKINTIAEELGGETGNSSWHCCETSKINFVGIIKKKE